MFECPPHRIDQLWLKEIVEIWLGPCIGRGLALLESLHDRF